MWCGKPQSLSQQRACPCARQGHACCPHLADVQLQAKGRPSSAWGEHPTSSGCEPGPHQGAHCLLPTWYRCQKPHTKWKSLCDFRGKDEETTQI